MKEASKCRENAVRMGCKLWQAKILWLIEAACEWAEDI